MRNSPGHPQSSLEILVHISAPSKLADDHLYRSLGEAYLAFQPDGNSETGQSRLRINLPSKSQSPLEESRKGKGKWKEAVGSAIPLVGDEEEHLDQLCITESQDLNFSSVVDNRSSPPPRRCPETTLGSGGLHGNQRNQTWYKRKRSLEMPEDVLPSQIGDSYPMPSQSLLQTSPSRVLQQFMVSSGLLSTETGDSSSPPLSAPSSSLRLPQKRKRPSTPYPENRHRCTIEGQEIIPVTPFLEKTSSPSSSKTAPPKVIAQSRSSPEECLHPDITHISDSPTDQPRPTPSPPPPPPPPPEYPYRQSAGSTSITSQPTSSPFDQEAATSYSLLSTPPPLLNTLEIHPPSPPPSLAPLTVASLISPNFAKLSRDLSSRYRPTANRPVRPLERGYWLVDCQTWPEAARTDAWSFLTQYVSCGLAGWGVWCTRGEDGAWIRVYCWGCVVKHTFLLVYLASRRRLKTTGAKWMDADGGEVVRVAPAGGSS